MNNIHPIFENILYHEFHERHWDLHREPENVVYAEEEAEDDCPQCAHVRYCNGGCEAKEYTGEYHFEKSLGFDKHNPEFIDAHEEFWNKEESECRD